MGEQERSGSRGRGQSQSQGGWVVDWGEGSAEQRSAPTNKPQYPQSTIPNPQSPIPIPITELPNYRITELLDLRIRGRSPDPGSTENDPETKKAAVTQGYRWSVEGRYGWVGGTVERHGWRERAYTDVLAACPANPTVPPHQ
nr:hypothetical protein SrhCFBP13529_01740 [Stenotrophomonas rhizophila]